MNMRRLLLLLIGLAVSGKLTAQEKPWPYEIPCRVESENPDLMFMTLGKVITPVAQGMFDPVTDQVRLSTGEILMDYYKKELGISFFQPIDKSHFELPPSGWCSWYYYYQEVSGAEIIANADWIGQNLKDFGARYVQIDDGWQGVGHGNAVNRDWNVIDKRFSPPRSTGMEGIASHIKSLGMIPGLWLAPHGHSDTSYVMSNRNVFLLKPDGTSASDTWEGKFLIDPSTTEAHDYLDELFTRMSGWGYDYFKIDGQPIVTREYRNKREYMQNPSQNTDSLYRATLKTIKSAIGENRYLLGCWIVPLEGIGIMDGSRTSADVVLDWKGFMTSVRSTMDYYFLHNVAWYCDPDVMLVRSPLPMDQARAWATLQGLTGQALMSSDRMVDLPAERVELLKRVYPATDIRPLDLFPAEKNKRIWDLKISHLGRSYDVVGVFNYHREEKQNLYVSWKELGLTEDQPVHAFDFWNQEYIGSWEKGISIELNPTSCQVLTLVPDDGTIQLVSTSRHITQGWVDLLEVNKSARKFSGKSQVVRNDPYEIRFAFPQGKNYKIITASAKNQNGNLAVKQNNYNGWATLTFMSPINDEIEWEIEFGEMGVFHLPVEAPEQPYVDDVTVNSATLKWTPRLQTVSGYKVFLDGEDVGFTPGCTFQLNKLQFSRAYKAEVQAVWIDGIGSKEKASVTFSLSDLLPGEVFLSSLEPVGRDQGWRLAGIDQNGSGSAITLDGKRYEKGLGIPPGSYLEYELDGLFTRFTSVVGIDDQCGREGEVEFCVKGDGKELWRSGLVKRSDNVKQVDIDIKGIKLLKLEVKRGNNGGSGDPADWAQAKIVRVY